MSRNQGRSENSLSLDTRGSLSTAVEETRIKVGCVGVYQSRRQVARSKFWSPELLAILRRELSMITKRKVIELEDGWAFMQKGIGKLEDVTEGKPGEQFQSEEYIMYYTTVYNMCTQEPPHDYSQQLYDRYKGYYDDYIDRLVLPALKEMHGEPMLRELVKRWNNHKIMGRWLSRLFNFLDRRFVKRKQLPTLQAVGLMCFRDKVYSQMQNSVKGAAITMIDREREGDEIDRAMLKNVVEIFVEMGMGSTDAYGSDFEPALLADTAAYYCTKAASWIEEDSCPDYMNKAEQRLELEKERVGHYLQASSEPKLLETVQQQLLILYENQLLEKEDSGCLTMLRDQKKEDLSRMYRLFCKIPNGLEPIAALFRQCIMDEPAIQREKEQASGIEEREIQDKYLQCVRECFDNNPLFQKVVKEALDSSRQQPAF